jgi:tRNA 2-thiouridine synthesizing protein A
MSHKEVSISIMNGIKPDKVQESVGQACPMPIVHMAKNLRIMAPGQVLEIKADDEGAHADVRSWCEQTGNEFLGEEDAGEYFRYLVRKKA